MTAAQQKRIYWGYIAAGIANLVGVLGSSRFFTNEAIPALDPVVMSNFGLLMICTWGLAYIAIAPQAHALPKVSAVLFFEKIIYSIAWIRWHQSPQNSLSAAFELDTQAGVFYSIYGLNDMLFAVFFAWAFWLSRKP